MLRTLDTSQLEMSWLKREPSNMLSMFVTFETSQWAISPSNLERRNMRPMFVTLRVFHLEISPLKVDFMFEKSAFTKDVAGWTLHDDAEPGSVFDLNKRGLRKQGMSDWVIAHYALDGIKHLDPNWQAALEAYKATESLFPVRERVRGGMGLEAKAMGIAAIAARVRGFYVPGVVPDATAPAPGMSLG